MGRVIVFGSINMDCVANVANHPKPGETISGKDLQYFPGGKGANQAVSAARLGAKTIMFGCVGNDGFSDKLIEFLKSQNIETSHIKKTDVATGTALIAVDQEGENTIIVIPGANHKIAFEQIDSFDFMPNDILVCQNEIPSEEMLKTFEKAKKNKVLIVYNPAPATDVDSKLFKNADFVIVNETEAEFYKSSLNSASSVIIETLGQNGVIVRTANDNYKIEGKKVNVLDTTGAGDCFTGALACALAGGLDIEKAANFSNEAASLSVQRLGAGVSMPYLSEMDKVWSHIDMGPKEPHKAT